MSIGYEIMKGFCEKNLCNKSYCVPDIVNIAFRLGFVDIRSFYIWMRCKEVFGKRRTVTIKKRISEEKKHTRKRYDYKKIRRYSNNNKTIAIKKLSKEVELNRVSLYQYANKNAIELLKKKDVFYLYCTKHLFDEEFAEILFQGRKKGFNRSKKLIAHISEHPNIGKYKFEEGKSTYKEDSVEKYLKNLCPAEVFRDVNNEFDIKTKTYIEFKSGIMYDDENVIYIRLSRGNMNDIIIENSFSYNKETIRITKLGYDVCKKIRDLSKKYSDKILLVESISKKMFDKNKEYDDLKRALSYLSAFKQEIFITVEK